MSVNAKEITDRARAEGYAWGRQDEMGMTETDRATAFADAYAEHAAEFYAGTIGMKENLRAFWKTNPRGLFAHTR